METERVYSQIIDVQGGLGVGEPIYINGHIRSSSIIYLGTVDMTHPIPTYDFDVVIEVIGYNIGLTGREGCRGDVTNGEDKICAGKITNTISGATRTGPYLVVFFVKCAL